MKIDKEIMEFIKGRRAIVLLNKTDLEMAIDKKEVRKYLWPWSDPYLCKRGAGH